MRPNHPHYGSMARERIIAALLSLMESTRFDEITVLQITQEADVARRTFYLYYTSKIDILNDYYHVLAKEYYDRLPDEVREDTRLQAEHFFSFWKQNRSYLQILDKQNMLFILMKNLDDYLNRTVSDEVAEKNVRYYTSFYAGGLWSILLMWVRRDFKESPAELADIAVRFDYLNIFKQIPV